MDAIATAAMEGRYEDIDENFNKVSQELVNLMRDTNDARYGFVIKPMIFDFLTKFVKDFKERFGSYPLNYMWSGEFVSAARFKKERLPLAKTPEATESVQKAAKIIEKYEGLHKREMWWKETGFPDFEPYTKISELGKVVKVEIAVTGNRKIDNRLAATKAYETGIITKREMEELIQPNKSGFVWHHVEDAKTMLLVPRDLHAVFKHTGGVFVKSINEKNKIE